MSVNNNYKCQVFGNLSGCIIAMGDVNLSKDNQVQTEDDTITCPKEQIGNDSSLHVSEMEMHTEEAVSFSPEVLDMVNKLKVFTNSSSYTLEKVKLMAERCSQPMDWACLMAVLDDYGLLIKRRSITAFVRAMIALGIIPELDEDGVTSLRKKIWRNLRNYDKGFRSWKPNMKSIKDYCYNLAEVLEKSDGFEYHEPKVEQK